MKKVTLVLILFVAICQQSLAFVEINETNFPDDRFRNYLLSQSYGQDGIITDDEIPLITKMVITTPTTSATVSKMQNMKGIEYFTALRELDCSWNEIDTLDLRNNPLLEKLNCSCYGGSVILGLAGNKNLKEVYCDVGYHKELDLSGCTSLTTLVCCTSCCIETLDISGCISLVNLELPYGNNRHQWIYNLKASGCTSLKEIRCFKASIYTLDASGCTSLENIECYENLLHEINVTGCTALKTLSCGGWNNPSYYTSLDLSTCVALEELSCGMSPLESLDLSNNRNLKSLWCSHTYLANLNISNCSDLTELDCSYSNLTTLDVSNNPLLVTLSCNNSQLTTLNLQANSKLSSLICNDNQLSQLDLSNNKELESIYCHNNKLHSLNVLGFSKLKTLFCETNLLEELNVKNTPSLNELNCADNNIKTLDVTGCSVLSSLSCSANQLTSLNVKDCNSLLSISCERNKLIGKSVDDFFESLPLLSEETNGVIYFKNNYYGDEVNECTKSQVAVANAKGWQIYYRAYNWSIYEGSSVSYTLLDETSTIPPVAATGVNVKVLRTIKAGKWSTICLPFAMSEEQTKSAFGDDVQLKDFTSWSSEENAGGDIVSLTISFSSVSAIEANHPYLIKVSSTISQFTVEGVDVDPEDEPYKQVGTNIFTRGRFTGTYVTNTTIPEQGLFISNDKFWYSKGLTKMKAFRGYFELADVLTSVDEAGARINMTEGVMTGITDVGENTTDGNEYYDLLGRRVKTPKHGLYIKNNKKVVVK